MRVQRESERGEWGVEARHKQEESMNQQENRAMRRGSIRAPGENGSRYPPLVWAIQLGFHYYGMHGANRICLTKYCELKPSGT